MKKLDKFDYCLALGVLIVVTFLAYLGYLDFKAANRVTVNLMRDEWSCEAVRPIEHTNDLVCTLWRRK